MSSAQTSSLPEAEVQQIDKGEEALLNEEAVAVNPEPESTLVH